MRTRPERIGNILSELAARHGFARLEGTRNYDAAWKEAVGPVAAEYTAVGSLRRGTLHVLVNNSTLMQELTFRKEQLLETLNRLLGNQQISDIRFRAATVR